MKVIGIQEDRLVFGGVIDGYGYVKNREVVNGDRMIVVGMDLICRFEAYMNRKIPGSRASWIKVSVSIMFMVT